MSVAFSVANRELVITDLSDGSILWSGLPGGHPVEGVWPISSTDGLVLLDYMSRGSGHFQNLLRVNPHGEVVWRADLPESGNNAYVDAEVQPDGTIVAHSWSGHRVVIDPQTGGVIDVEFVK